MFSRRIPRIQVGVENHSISSVSYLIVEIGRMDSYFSILFIFLQNKEQAEDPRHPK